MTTRSSYLSCNGEDSFWSLYTQDYSRTLSYEESGYELLFCRNNPTNQWAGLRFLHRFNFWRLSPYWVCGLAESVKGYELLGNFLGMHYRVFISRDLLPAISRNWLHKFIAERLERIPNRHILISRIFREYILILLENQQCAFINFSWVRCFFKVVR